MKKTKAIIVDDESEGINTLQFMLREYCPEVEVVASYQSSVEALKVIKKEQPDLLFLDIKMPHINGLELLELLGSGMYNVIFTTAYDEYILQALRLNALDYLKKPIDAEELINAVNRLKSQGDILQSQITSALEYFNANFEINPQTPFGIKEGNKIKFVKLLDISCCKSDGNFTIVYLKDGTNIYASIPLGALEERLPDKFFIRPHREFIINGYQIKEYDKAEGGSIKMICNKQIPISRSRKEDLRLFIENI